MPKTAVVVVDMLNPYEHEDAEELAGSVREALPRMVDLRDRAHEAGDDVLLIYANDNYERWDETRDDLVRTALEGAHPELVEPILPPASVPFLSKGRHSIFYETPMAHLLRTEGVERVVLCGQVTEQCIFYSALDAYLRGLEVVIPTDAVAHIVPEFAEAALGMAEKNAHAELRPAGEIDLPG
jgi:nicotinamidase-related amidase